MSADVQQPGLFGDAGLEAPCPRHKRRSTKIEPWVQRLAEGIASGDIHVGHAGPLSPNRKIHGLSSALIRAAFCDYFGLRGEHADILVVLLERPGEPMPTRDLAKALNSHRPPASSAIYERIRVLREVLDAESLDSGGFLDARGYCLTESGMEECMAALREMAGALLKFGPAALVDGQPVERPRAPAPTP